MDERVVGLTTRVAGAVLASVAVANALVAVAVPPKTPIFSPTGRTVLALMSVVVAALGVALAVGRRWSIWPLIAAVAASLIVTLAALISSEPVRLGQLPLRVVGSLVFTYTNGLIAVATTYAFGLAVLLANALSRPRRAQSAPHPSPPLTRAR